jgi:hypothetical protein
MDKNVLKSYSQTVLDVRNMNIGVSILLPLPANQSTVISCHRVEGLRMYVLDNGTIISGIESFIDWYSTVWSE